jgi:nicotinamide mononucleotide transporter
MQKPAKALAHMQPDMLRAPMLIPKHAWWRWPLLVGLTAGFTLVLLRLTTATEALGATSGALCVWLAAESDPWTWPIGIANNVFFLVLFWRSGLFADALLQVVYILVSSYGWWRWRSGRGAASVRPVARTPRREALLVLAVSIASTAALGWYLGRHTPSTVPWGDALTTVLSLAAQWLMSRRLVENWWVWIAADILYVPLYLAKGLTVTAALYVVFLLMCIAGLRGWLAELRAGEPAASDLAPDAAQETR